MDDQDHRKNHLPGHESHGVHLCHKCGWPFPNQHPSARHRRAHKRVCGTLEDYKLLDAEGAIHSDDEHLSDDDRKTPSPKFLEREGMEKGTVGIAEGSTRQGDEKSLETGRELAYNVEKITENDPEIAPSLNNDTIAGHLDDSGKTKKPEIPESMTILPGTIPKTEDHISSSTINAAACSLSDGRKDEVAGEVSDDRSSAFGLKPISSETPRDVSQESDNIGPDSGTANCSAPYLGEETNAKEMEQTNLDRNYLDDLVSLTVNAGETSVVVPVVQKTEEIITDFGPADEILRLKEEHINGLDTKMSISELSHKVDHVALGNSSIDAYQIKDVGQGVDFVSSGHSSKNSNGKEDHNENVFVLSLPDDITVVDQAENMIRGLRDMSSHQSLNLETCEMITDQKDDTKDSVPKSDFSDLQSCDFNESSEVSAFENDPKQQCGSSKPIEGEVPVQKDQKDDAKDSVPKSDFMDLQSWDFNKSSVSSASEMSVFENDPKQQCGSSKPIEGEVSVQKVQKDDTKDSVPKSDFSDRQSCDFNESSEFSASEVSVFENDPKQQCGSSKPIEGEVPVQKDQKDDAKDSVPKSDFMDLQSWDFNKSSVLSASEMSVSENDPKQQCGSGKPIEGEVPVQKDDDRLQMKVSTSETQVSGDLESGVYALVTDRQKAQELFPPEDKNPHDYCNQEKAIEKSDIDTDDNIGRVGKEDHAGSTLITESGTDFNKCQAKLESTFVASDPVSNQQKGEILKCNVYHVDGMEREFVSTPEENVPLKAEATPISLHEYQVVPDDVLDVSRMKLNVDHCHLSRATDLVPAECVGGTIATESHEVMDTELLQRDTKGQTMKGQPILPSDAKSSVQNAATIVDNCNRDSGGCAGDIRSESLPGECVDKSIKQKFGTSTPDVSIDSSSQTDSLEGHWGSVSVLSTQSDITAITETGPFTSTDFRASAEAVTASLKNLQVTSEGQRYDKSENFEAPSFMTLVEPRGSHVQTIHNSPHPETSSPQSGWFPSLTHVVNESQGRKKNEQIIAKVTNWSTGRQHAPLKSLLSEAKAEAKPKSPNLMENPGIAATQKDGMATKVTSVAGSNRPTSEPAGKKSNSPPDVEGEKKKVKGRPYWAQFVCCSSVGSKA